MALKRKIISSAWKLSVFFRRLYRSQKHVVWILSVMVFTMTFYYLYNMGLPDKPGVGYTLDINYTEMQVRQKLKQSVLEDKGAGCVMPYMDPFSPEAMAYNEDRPKVVCQGLDWVECYQSECSVVKDILETTDDIVCNYKDIVYVNDYKYFIGDPVKVHGAEKYILNRSDHVKVSCSGRDKKGLGILSSRWFGYKAGLRPVVVTPPEGRENTINIMLLCFDSTSHNGFIRKMPKSYKVIKEEINSVILKSYNIVGEGTFSSLYPMLTGLDLPVWQGRMKIKNMEYKNFLFRHLKVDGYRTAYFEDMPWIGTFQGLRNGFDSRPADHYLRPFLMEESSNGRKWWHGIKGRFCIGNVAEYALMLNLTKQFLRLGGKRFCLTFIADICHDDFNQISTADDDVVDFLRDFKRQGFLEDTLLIVMGDHGAKYDNIRKTYQGRIEERLPFVSIALPSRLMKVRPQALLNLEENIEVLTTPYDMHATLLDVTDLNKHRSFHHVPGSDLPRGMSMLEPIPKSRSCGEAGILPHWCACAKWRNISDTDAMYKRTAGFLLDYINQITEEKRSQCAKRTLETIHWVMMHMPHREMLKKLEDKGLFGEGKEEVRSDEEYYQVKLTATPAHAMYEASMIYYVKENYFMINDKDVSRISAYRHEPDCVLETHPHLNKYCYCVDKDSSQSTYNIDSKNN